MLYTWENAPIDLITKAGVLTPPRGQRSGNKRRYMDIITAFDIETTTVNEKYAVMYIWQFQIGLNSTVTGRTWQEFLKLIDRIRAAVPSGAHVVCFVHNLSFEFQFLRGYYDFKPEEVFAVDRRKVLRADMAGCIEFRCSYLHTNMRLDTFLSKMGVEHGKISGFDYSKPRYWFTPLTAEELEYCVNDVRGLVEAITIEMMRDGDTIYTLPSTSTGYVRRDVKEAMRRVPWNFVHDQLPDIEIFNLLREAFRGGNTHANRYFVGQILENVRSYDRSSSYPDIMVNNEFPVSRFQMKDTDGMTLGDLSDLIDRRHKAVLIRIALENVKLRDPLWGCPYIPVDKCRCLIGAIKDNGRVLAAEYLEITLTDIDWRILASQYKFSGYKIITCAYARYGKLPKVLRDLVIMYYDNKTKQSGIMREKAKALINAVYGMAATNPCKIPPVFTGTGETGWDFDDAKTVEDLLNKSNRSAFFCYQWGVWVSAGARQALEIGIRAAAAGSKYPMDDPRFSDFVYCDTDSVKYIGNVDWMDINAKLQSASEESGAFADDPNGKRHYMGVYEPDKGYPARFATRGAKKYVVEHPDGKLEATIAGVAKREDGGRVSGGMELTKMGGIEAFLKPVIKFTEAGGTQLIYNDTERFTTTVDGHEIEVRECVCIKPDEYTLSDGKGYPKLLQASRIYRDFRRDILGIF